MTSLTPIFYGTIHHGDVSHENLAYYEEYLMTLEGKKVQMTVETRKKPRSGAENRYYWSVIVKMIAEETGEHPDTAHYSKKYLGGRRMTGVDHKDGTREDRVQDSNSMTTVEFEDYLKKCREWASEELSIYIPLPNEVLY